MFAAAPSFLSSLSSKFTLSRLLFFCCWVIIISSGVDGHYLPTFIEIYPIFSSACSILDKFRHAAKKFLFFVLFCCRDQQTDELDGPRPSRSV